MENSGAALAAAVEATVFLCYFKEMPDHRQAGRGIDGTSLSDNFVHVIVVPSS